MACNMKNVGMGKFPAKICSNCASKLHNDDQIGFNACGWTRQAIQCAAVRHKNEEQFPTPKVVIHPRSSWNLMPLEEC